MYNDVHVHTFFSSDSEVAVEEQIERAIHMGMEYICITDHQDYDYPEWKNYTYQVGENADIGAYYDYMSVVRDRYVGRINMLIGMEFGLQPHLGPVYDEVYEKYPFDMCIGSTHVYEGRDTEDQTLYSGRSKEESVRAYFVEEMKNLSVTHGYDTVGHLDYVLRDIPGKNKDFSYKRYADILDELLLLLINRYKAIELNTKPLVVGMRDSSPGREVFKRYRELGGELVTLGSDAHFPERIGACFDIATDILKDAGFKYYCVYKKHEPLFFPL